MLTRVHALSLSAAASALLIAGCGSSSSGNGVASKSAQEIAKTAINAAGAAQSVHTSGTVENGGHALRLDAKVNVEKSLEGEFTQDGYSFKIIVVDGNAYLNGKGAFEHFGNPAFTKLLNGRWLQIPASDPEFHAFSQFTHLHELFKLPSEHPSLTKLGESTINGQKVIGVRDNSKGGVLYVATTGTAYPVAITKAVGSNQILTFGDWNATFRITAPKNSINLSELTSGSGK